MFRQRVDKNGKNQTNATLCMDRNGATNPPIPGVDFPDLDTLLKKKPRLAVIALGTNDIGNYCLSIVKAKHNKKAGDWALTGARELAKKVLAATGNCIWVLPLSYKSGLYFNYCRDAFGSNDGYATALDKLRKTIGGTCTVVESSNCPMPSKFDRVGLHPTSGGKELGQCIGNQINLIVNGTTKKSSRPATIQ